MSSLMASETTAPGEQTAGPTPSASSSPDLAVKTTSSPENAEANMLAANKYPSPDTEDVVEKASEEISDKKAAPTKAKLVLKNTAQEAPWCDQDAGEPAAKSTNTSKKRKANGQNGTTTELKNDQAAESDLPPKKKAKRASPGTKKVSPKATGKKRAQDQGAQNDQAKEMPPQSLRPAILTKAVANKVHQVIKFTEEVEAEDSRLDRETENKDLISIPESLLLSAITRMRLHYQIDVEQQASISDVEDAIVKRFKRDIGRERDVDWVTINTSIFTYFGNQIQKKIACGLLGDVNLLEIELEMCKRDLLKQTKKPGDVTAEEGYDDERFKRHFGEILNRIVSRADKAPVEKGQSAFGNDKAAMEGDGAFVGEDTVSVGFGGFRTAEGAAEAAAGRLDSAVS